MATFSSREATFLKTLAWPDLSPAVLSALDMWSMTLTNITTYSDSPGYRLQTLRNLVHRHLVDEPKRREALRLYEEEALGIHQIAAQQHQGVKAIRRFLKDSGVDTQRNKPRRGASQEVAAKSEEMRRLYETENKTNQEVSIALGLASGTVSRHLRMMGVEMRRGIGVHIDDALAKKL